MSLIKQKMLLSVSLCPKAKTHSPKNALPCSWTVSHRTLPSGEWGKH